MVSDATTVHDLENVLGDAGFWYASAVAAAGAAIVGMRARRAQHEPGIAFVVAVAALVGLRVSQLLVAALVVGVGMLGFGEWVFRAAPRSVRLGVEVPGAAIVAAALPDGSPFWARAALVGVVLLAALAVPGHDVRSPRLVPVLLAIGAVGVYACVPDTEAPIVLLGATLVASAIVLEPRLRPSLGFPAVVGIVAWVAAFGGLGRPGAIVGGLACLGVLLLPVPRARCGRAGEVAAVVVQLGLVAYEARVAGFEHSAGRALTLALPAFAVAWAVLLVVDRVERR